jgi:hypothetical protein
MTRSAPAAPPPPAEDLDAMSKPSRAFVVLSITVTLLLLAGMVWLVLHGSTTQHVPASCIVVHGNAKWKGTKLSVTGPNLHMAMEASLEAHNKYHVPFFVPPGEYTLTISPPPGAPPLELRTRHFTLRAQNDDGWVDLAHDNDEESTTGAS